MEKGVSWCREDTGVVMELGVNYLRITLCNEEN